MTPAVLDALHAFGGVFVVVVVTAAIAIGLLVVIIARWVRRKT